MKTANRTTKDIHDYIRRHLIDGKLEMSLLDIAKEVGYSNATIHRVLRRLESAGFLSVDRSGKKPNSPNTITYLQEFVVEEDVLQEGLELANSLSKKAEELIQLLNSKSIYLKELQRDAKAWRDTQSS